MVIFMQYLGAAIFVTAAQSIFNNSMRHNVVEYAPGVDIETIIEGGAAAVRSLVSGPQLDMVVGVYAMSLNRVMYLAAALGVTFFAFGCGFGCKDIRK
jgi:hypothetical protein